MWKLCGGKWKWLVWFVLKPILTYKYNYCKYIRGVVYSWGYENDRFVNWIWRLQNISYLWIFKEYQTSIIKIQEEYLWKLSTFNIIMKVKEVILQYCICWTGYHTSIQKKFGYDGRKW